jgi:hypothetical protein
MKYIALMITALMLMTMSQGQVSKRNVNPASFAVSFKETVTSAGGADIFFTKQYNANSADINIGGRSIKINKTGLYHFDYYIHASSLSTKSPIITTYLAGSLPSWPLIFIKEDAIPISPADGVCRKSWNFSVDVYISAPATIMLVRNIIGATAGTTIDGVLMGHIICE